MKLLWTVRAEGDLRAIRKYSVEHWGGRVAIDYLKAIRDAARGVATGQRRLRELPGGYASVSVRSHILVLRVDPEAGTMTVARVLHQAMDPERHLPRDPDLA